MLLRDLLFFGRRSLPPLLGGEEGGARATLALGERGRLDNNHVRAASMPVRYLVDMSPPNGPMHAECSDRERQKACQNSRATKQRGTMIASGMYLEMLVDSQAVQGSSVRYQRVELQTSANSERILTVIALGNVFQDTSCTK